MTEDALSAAGWVIDGDGLPSGPVTQNPSAMTNEVLNGYLEGLIRGARRMALNLDDYAGSLDRDPALAEYRRRVAAQKT